MKILKRILLVLIIVALDITIFSNVVNAINTNKGDKIQVYKAKKLSTSLKKDGQEVEINYLYHIVDGEKMPVYYLDEEPLDYFPSTRDINIIGKLENTDIWRILVNGYPYKNPNQIGCNDNEEAYIATQNAIYCYHQKDLLEKYTKQDARGERILNAINKILNSASTSSEKKTLNKLEIKKQNLDWEKDETYVSKTYKLEANTQIKSYKVYLKNSEGKSPEEIKIVDKNNQTKGEFEGTEEFKIMIPEEKIKDIDKFEINVEAQVYTKPMTEGVAGKELTNFVMLGKYEKYYGNLKEEYKNKILPVTGK